MKLAEALSIRKDLQKRIDQTESRLCRNATVQEGDQPTEDPTELFAELDSCLQQLQTLIYRINATNMSVVCNGKTLTQMMAEREVLIRKITALRNVTEQASRQQERYSRSEIKQVITVDVRALNKQVDALSQQLRKLDIEIQQLNFSEELR